MGTIVLSGLPTFLVPWEHTLKIKPSMPAGHSTQQQLEMLIYVPSVRRAYKAFLPCHVTTMPSALPFQPTDPATEHLIGINSHVNS